MIIILFFKPKSKFSFLPKTIILSVFSLALLKIVLKYDVSPGTNAVDFFVRNSKISDFSFAISILFLKFPYEPFRYL